MGGNYTYTFLYDDKNRLTDAVTTLTGASESYSYNSDGAIQSKNRDGNNLEYKYWSGNNRLQKVIKNGTDTTNYAYDTKGNIYGGYGVLKEYNYQNLPTEMFNEDSTIYKYSYNSNGKRIKKTNAADNSGEYYLRDYTGRELVIYDNETGEPKIANVHGNGLIGRIEINGTTDERFYYLKDHLGSIRATLNQYSTVVSAQDYFPYGEIIREYVYGMPLEKYKFTEKERDVESGYDHFDWRTYDSKLAMWLQVDPLSGKYPGWSPYNYALCDPVNKFDPNGMAPIDKRTKEFISGSEAAALMDATFAKFFTEGKAGVFVGNDSESLGGGIRDLFAAWSGGYEVTYTNNVLRFGGFYNNVTKHGFDQGSKRVYSVDYKLTNDEDVVIDSFDPEPEKFGRTKNGELLMSLNFTSKGKIATSLTLSVSDMKKYLSQYGYTLYQDKNENWFVRSVDSEEYKKDQEEKE